MLLVQFCITRHKEKKRAISLLSFEQKSGVIKNQLSNFTHTRITSGRVCVCVFDCMQNRCEVRLFVFRVCCLVSPDRFLACRVLCKSFLCTLSDQNSFFPHFYFRMQKSFLLGFQFNGTHIVCSFCRTIL